MADDNPKSAKAGARITAWRRRTSHLQWSWMDCGAAESNHPGVSFAPPYPLRRGFPQPGQDGRLTPIEWCAMREDNND